MGGKKSTEEDWEKKTWKLEAKLKAMHEADYSFILAVAM